MDSQPITASAEAEHKQKFAEFREALVENIVGISSNQVCFSDEQYDVLTKLQDLAQRDDVIERNTYLNLCKELSERGDEQELSCPVLLCEPRNFARAFKINFIKSFLRASPLDRRAETTKDIVRSD